MFEWLQGWFALIVSWIDYPLVKLLSYVLSPILALISFWFARQDRRDLRSLTASMKNAAEKLGEAKAQAAFERNRVAEKQVELERTQLEVKQEHSSVKRLRSELEGITKGSAQLWKLRPNQPFAEYKSWMRDPLGARIVTFGNLKGGVGKDHIGCKLRSLYQRDPKEAGPPNRSGLPRLVVQHDDVGCGARDREVRGRRIAQGRRRSCDADPR